MLPALDDIPESLAAFPLGVQAGDPSSGSAILWTQALGDGELVLFVWDAVDGGIHFEDTVPVSDQGVAHVEVNGLPAHTALRYAFALRAGGLLSVRSTVGRFVTAPEPGSLPKLRLVGWSCSENDRRPFEALIAGAQIPNTDALLLLGDTTYNDGAVSLQDYREKWRAQLSHPSYVGILASAGHFATWDDHEVDNNWSRDNSSAAQIQAATDAFFEHVALRRHAVSTSRVWRSYRWGDTAEIFILDSRSERNEDDDRYISTEQMDWLTSGLASSTAVFKVILNSVPITNLQGLYDFAQSDRWEGFPAQRTQLLEAAAATSGVLFITGDIHRAFAGRVEPSPPFNKLYEIEVGPAEHTDYSLGQISSWHAGIDWVDPSARPSPNVGVIDLDPTADPPQARVQWIRGDGSVAHEQLHVMDH